MERSKLYVPLATSTLGAILLTLAIYSLRSGNWPGPRAASAAMMSLLAAGLTWLAFRPFGLLLGLRGGWRQVALVYFVAFVLVSAAQAWLRGW